MNGDTDLNQGLLQTTTIELDHDVDADDMETGLAGMQGVRSVEVDGKTVSVTYDPTEIDENAVRGAIENGGTAPLAGGGTAGHEEESTRVAPFLYGETNPQ